MIISEGHSRNFLEQITDDFRYFVDVDRSKQTFLIRDMLTEEEIYRIPTYLMRYMHSPEETLVRFRWVGSDMIKLVNPEGQEKLVYSGTEEFEQLEFN